MSRATGPEPVAGTVVARADTRPAWQRQSDALVRRIRAEPDEPTRYALRLELLRVRYTPWRKQAQRQSNGRAAR